MFLSFIHVIKFAALVEFACLLRSANNPYKGVVYNFHDPNYLIAHERVFTANAGRRLPPPYSYQYVI